MHVYVDDDISISAFHIYHGTMPEGPAGKHLFIILPVPYKKDGSHTLCISQFKTDERVFTPILCLSIERIKSPDYYESTS